MIIITGSWKRFGWLLVVGCWLKPCTAAYRQRATKARAGLTNNQQPTTWPSRPRAYAWGYPAAPPVLQIPQPQRRAFPGTVEFALHPLRIDRFLLRFQTFQQSKQRAAIAWISLQVGAKNGFRLGRLAALQQRRAQRFPHRIIPVGRLIVGQGVLRFDRFLPMLDRSAGIARDVGAQNCVGNL